MKRHFRNHSSELGYALCASSAVEAARLMWLQPLFCMHNNFSAKVAMSASLPRALCVAPTDAGAAGAAGARRLAAVAASVVASVAASVVASVVAITASCQTSLLYVHTRTWLLHSKDGEGGDGGEDAGLAAVGRLHRRRRRLRRPLPPDAFFMCAFAETPFALCVCAE